MPHVVPVFVFRRRDRDGWWIAWRDRLHRACEAGCRSRNVQGLHRVRAGDSKKEAVNMAQWVRDRLHPWNTTERGIDWCQFVAEYMLSIANRSAAHRKVAERVLIRFTLAMRPVASGLVQANHVDRYLAELTSRTWGRDEAGKALAQERPASDREKDKHWRYLHALFAFGLAPARRYCATNPVLVTARPTVEEVLVRAPRWLDVVRLLECVSDIGANDPQGLYLLILLAVVTGLRTGDVLRLRVEDFESAGDETGGVALWWARNRKGRKVKVCGIPAVVEALVTTRLMELPERQERFFFWPSFPYPLWKRLRERAKVVALRPQALRRAAGAVAGATAIQRAGVQQLQHSSARVFRRYYEDREQAAIALASSLFVPELPRMPAFVLGKLDRRGRRWAAELVV